MSGVALVLLGVLVNVSAVAQHVQLVKELRTGTWVPGKISRNAIPLALVAVGTGMAIYLILVH